MDEIWSMSQVVPVEASWEKGDDPRRPENPTRDDSSLVSSISQP